MVIDVSAQGIRRWTGLALSLIAAAGAQIAAADPPNAVYQPDAFRESITSESLQQQGFDPEQYKLEIPLTGALSVQREYVRSGETGLFSTGIAEHGTDTVKLHLNQRGAIEFYQDEASAEGPYGLMRSLSRKRRASLTQAFGKGTTEGSFSLIHEDNYASQTDTGYTRAQTDSASLSLGLAKDLGLTAGASQSSGLAQVDSRTRKIDVALGRPDSSEPALAEFHQTESCVGGATSEVQQMALRTPTVKLGGVGTMSAAHQRTDSSVGTESVNSVNLTASPAEAITVSASHVEADRSAAPDTGVTTVNSQIRIMKDTTVSATYSGTETEDAGLATRRSVELARTPSDGTGLGLRAAYVDLGVPGAEVDPTVDFQLDYTIGSEWEFHGRFHDEHNRPSPELAAGMKVPLLGGSLGLDYNEHSYDAAAQAVRLSRVYGAEMSRSIAWGLSGKVGYQRTDGLADSTRAERLRIGLGGETRLLGKVDVQYETGTIRTPAGEMPDSTTIGVSLSREIGVGELAISARRSLPAGPADTQVPSDQIRLDLTANW
jgi:hypothetical protein